MFSFTALTTKPLSILSYINIRQTYITAAKILQDFIEVCCKKFLKAEATMVPCYHSANMGYGMTTMPPTLERKCN